MGTIGLGTLTKVYWLSQCVIFGWLLHSCQPKIFVNQDVSWTNEIAKEFPKISEQTDDPFNYALTENQSYKPKISDPFWVSPVKINGVAFGRSNNNVSIAIHNGRLFVAMRTGKTHFASKHTQLHILSTSDFKNWRKELSFANKTDFREPFLIVMNDTLRFFCFEAGTKMTAFEPKKISQFNYIDEKWSEPKNILSLGEVHWDMKNRMDTTWFSSYIGSHYQLDGPSNVQLKFGFFDKESQAKQEPVYIGGVSETAFEFDKDTNLWAITRLEDGDETGFGSHVVFADKQDKYAWEFPKLADPNCYMSPKMFRHQNEIYLIARKQLGKQPFGRAKRTLSWRKQRLKNWVRFSLTPKTTALYRIESKTRTVKWVMDLPGTGDTAFPSIQRLNDHQFLIANYSSPLNKKKRPWLFGQLGKTGIYLILLEFENNGN